MRGRRLPILSAVLVGLGACGGEPAGGPAPATAAAATVRAELGPVRVSVALVPAEPRLSDEPELTLTVEMEEGVDVELPPFGAAVGGFDVLSLREPLPERQEGRRVLRRVLLLEPRETGEHVIPAVAVRFQDRRPGADGALHVVATDPLTVQVTSAVAGGAPSLADLGAPAGPVELPVERSFPFLGAGTACAGVALVLLAILLARRRRARVPAAAPEPTPSERAHAEFLRLLADDPLARGDLPGFYVELTGIVRRCIERTTGVRAPEQTTDEFLRDMRSHAAFDAVARERLAGFLQAADLVKFAAARPSRVEIEESFRRAQEFTGLPGELRLGPGATA